MDLIIEFHRAWTAYIIYWLTIIPVGGIGIASLWFFIYEDFKVNKRFLYLMIFIIGVFLTIFTSLTAKHLRIFEYDGWIGFIDSNFWDFRCSPLMVGAWLYLTWICKQIYGSYLCRKGKCPNRRKHD